MDDWVLLGRYVESGCQESFDAIVTRHAGWVFSVSLRAVRDRHLAEDVTQAVFLILARKAAGIREGTPLSGWLFKTARFAVSDALKRRTRMRNRENRFAEFFRATAREQVNPLFDSGDVSDELSHTLDEGVACLSESDRQAVLLRFYENKTLAEVGAILGISEEAAKKRVARAVTKLRKFFVTRGVVASMAIVLLMLARRADAVSGMPAIAGVPASGTACGIADGALRLMAHARGTLLGAIFAAGLGVVIGLPLLWGALRPAAAPELVSIAPAEAMQFHPIPEPVVEPERKPATQPTLPEQSRFADLWIAYKGQLLWRSDAYENPRPQPFLLKAAERQERPYAVAVDPSGNFFIRPLNNSILDSPTIKLAHYDFSSGPVDSPSRVAAMMSFIEPEPAAEGGALGLLPPAASKILVEKQWQKLRRSIDDDVETFPGDDTIHVELRRPLDAPVYNFDGGPMNFSMINVPEPTTAGALLALGLASCAVLCRRRRNP